MSCFFGCFRIKQRHQGRSNSISKSISSKNWVPFVSKRKLASVLLHVEENGSPPEQSPVPAMQGKFGENRSEDELKNEAGAQKGCNPLIESPTENRKASRSCRTSLKELWNEPLDQPYVSTNRLSENSISQHTNVRYKLEEQQTRLQDGSCTARDNPDNSTLFEYMKHAYEIYSDKLQYEIKLDSTGSKHSPLPTAPRMKDEMRTPEATSPAKKVVRIRTETTEYVHPVLNHIQSSSEQNAVIETFHHQNTDQSCPESPSSVIPAMNKEPHIVVSSLSQWLKLQSPSNNGSQKSESLVRDRPRSVRSTDEDMPIIGMVAAHWSEDKPSQSSPKWWDGNGIPNLTNKYKEDQKVSYYATSFEERLEKALSEESILTKRKLHDAERITDEGDEDDTAASRVISNS